MSGRLPAISAKDLIKALKRGGFSVIRTKGSHKVVRHDDDPTRQAIVPDQGHKDLKRGLVQGILRDLGVSAEELVDLLNG